MTAWMKGWSIIGVLAGCAAVDDDSALVPCPHEAVCWGPRDVGFLFEGRLQWDGTCIVGDLVLGSGGTVAQVDDPGAPIGGARWSDAPYGLDLCYLPGWCYTCEFEDVGSGTTGVDAPPARHCTGYPRSCGSVSPGSCSSIRGCRMHNRVRWDGSLDPECTGSADPCDGIHDADRCDEQGCDWES